jgi:hypothetical protein
MVPASQQFILGGDTSSPMMEACMFGESTQVLLFLAIVGLTMLSTIDLVMQPVKQQKNKDQER